MLKDTVLWDQHNPFQYFRPIAVSPLTLTFTGNSSRPAVTGPYGGIDFDNCSLVTDCEDNFLVAAHEKPDSGPLAGLSGRLVVVNRNHVTPDLGERPGENTLDIAYDRSRSVPTVALSADRVTTDLGEPVTFTMSRTSGRLDLPIAVRYVAGGTVDGYPGAKQPAVTGLDIDGLSGMVIIPAHQRNVTFTVNSRVVDGRTGPRHLTVALQAGHGYELPARNRDRIVEVTYR